MRERTTYRLFKYTDADGYEEFAHMTSANLAAALLRACEAKAGPDVLYEVRPALPKQEPRALEVTT